MKLLPETTAKGRKPDRTSGLLAGGAPAAATAEAAREATRRFTVPNAYHRRGGHLVDLAAPRASDIEWGEIAERLGRLQRFTGAPGALSVAQHCVMGADALYRETGDGVLAGYFVLHDAHEALIGDLTRPTIDLIQWHVAKLLAAAHYPGQAGDLVSRAVATAKGAIDAVIHAAANLPLPDPASAARIADMDARMLRAEGIVLFGKRAGANLPAAGLPPPKLTGSLRPWGPAKADIAWLDRLQRYLGISARPYP